MPKENLKVKIFLDTFEDVNKKELVTFVRYQTEIEKQVFDLFLREESKRLLKFLYDRNEFFDIEDEKFVDLNVTNNNSITEYSISLFGKVFKLLPKKNDAEMLEYLVND